MSDEILDGVKVISRKRRKSEGGFRKIAQPSFRFRHSAFTEKPPCPCLVKPILPIQHTIQVIIQSDFARFFLQPSRKI